MSAARHTPRAAETVNQPTVELQPPGFVGRQQELMLTTAALREPPALVIIEGEAGIGKTRLVGESLAALRCGGEVLRTSCAPHLEYVPLAPVVEAMRRLPLPVDQLQPSPLAGALRPLFPELASYLPPLPEPLDDPEATRHRLCAAVAELLQQLGITTLIVEDAQWADTSTTELLLMLVRSTALTMLVTHRPEEVSPESLLRHLSSQSRHSRSRTLVRLEPLSRTEVQQLIGSMLSTSQISEDFIQLLHESTDGVPLVVEETMLLLADRGDIARRVASSAWVRRTIDRLQVPPTVRDSVIERTRRLSSETRRVIKAVAVLAEPADETLLESVAGLDKLTVRSAVAKAVDCGLLQEVAAGRIGFRHGIASRAIYEATALDERRGLHARAAEALQTLQPQPVSRLARHFREAGDRAQWSRYAEAAADHAIDSGNDQAAVLLLHELLTAGTHPPEHHAQLARKLAEAALYGAMTGDLAQQVVTVLQDARADETISAPRRGELRLLFGRLLLRLGMGQDAAAYAEIEAAVEDLHHDPTLAAQAMLHLGWPWTHTWSVHQHLRWLQRATELLQRIESPADRLAFRITHATALLMLGEPAGWHAAAQIPSSGGGTARERQHILRGQLNFAQCEIEWGHHGRARQRLAAATQLAQQARIPAAIGMARFSTAILDWYTGAWDQLADTLAELADAEETDPSTQLDIELIQAQLELAHGARATAERHLRNLLRRLSQQDRAEAPHLASPPLARIRLVAGEADKALALTTPDMEIVTCKGAWLWATNIAPVHVDALTTTGAVHDAQTLVDAFAAWLHQRDAPAPAAALATCQAILTETNHPPEQAADRWAHAAAAWAALPRPHDGLLSLERQGRCLLAAGETQQAITVLSSTEQRLSDLGAGWDARRVAHILRQHGLEIKRGWRGGPQGYGSRLSPRELEAVQLAATGLTNKEIAKAMWLSPHTVTQYLSNAMRKMEVNSRATLVQAAAKAGLLTDD